MIILIPFKVYWEKPNFSPSIEDIKQELITLQAINNEIYIVKRVSRDMNDEIYIDSNQFYSKKIDISLY